ncbi:MAG: amidohydrolase [Acidimicrobiales bacterium]|nr:amidohydrolase [Acidimicrobiales bacterium]
MSTELLAKHRIIDVDTHITEPPDVWTDRMSKSKWGDAIPHIERVDGVDAWFVGDERVGSPGPGSMAGFNGVVPSGPKTFDDIHPAMYDAAARLKLMDELGVDSQVLYSNVGGFGGQAFRKMGDAEFVAECLRAFNDFVIDFSSADPNRLIPVMSTPFWDVDFAVAEIERGVAKGHKAVNFCNQPDSHGEPPLASRHWDPIWAAAQDAGVPISFHIGGGDIGALMQDPAGMGFQANFAKVSSLIMVDNMRCVGDLIFGGICHRFPDLKFVSVESGVGWIPGVLETFDWQWRGGDICNEHPEYDLLPSEYFRRQIYGSFWFERASAIPAIEMYPDNILYETDYPHPTCQHPGPRSPGLEPRQYIDEALGALPDETLDKVLFSNAAALYGIS